MSYIVAISYNNGFVNIKGIGFRSSVEIEDQNAVRKETTSGLTGSDMDKTEKSGKRIKLYVEEMNDVNSEKRRSTPISC